MYFNNLRNYIKYSLLIIVLIISNNSNAEIGGNFILNDFDNNKFDISLSKKVKIVFFGFLNCPDICPNTLQEISNIIVKLGEKSNKVNFFFVTVDPERDTVINMREYLDNFNENIIGITGEVESIKKFLKSMHVYYKKVFISKDFYTLDHSSQLYIFKKNGNFFGTISTNEEERIVLKKIESTF